MSSRRSVPMTRGRLSAGAQSGDDSLARQLSHSSAATPLSLRTGRCYSGAVRKAFWPRVFTERPGYAVCFGHGTAH